jgi:hypothetical protein
MIEVHQILRLDATDETQRNYSLAIIGMKWKTTDQVHRWEI